MYRLSVARKNRGGSYCNTDLGMDHFTYLSINKHVNVILKGTRACPIYTASWQIFPRGGGGSFVDSSITPPLPSLPPIPSITPVKYEESIIRNEYKSEIFIPGKDTYFRFHGDGGYWRTQNWKKMSWGRGKSKEEPQREAVTEAKQCIRSRESGTTEAQRYSFLASPQAGKVDILRRKTF